MATYSLEDLENSTQQFEETLTDDARSIGSIMRQCVDIAEDAEDDGRDPVNALKDYYLEVEEYLVSEGIDTDNSFDLNTIQTCIDLVEATADKEE